MDKIYSHVDANVPIYIERLAEAVAIASVSAEPARRPEVIRMVEWAAEWLKKLGAVDVTLHPNGTQEAPGGQTIPLPPILTARYGTDASKKTVVVYGHLDVQPAQLSDGWHTDPFVLTEKDGKLYGRGSTDDKAPVLAWLWAIEAYQAAGKDIPVNIKFILEGMEESGSEGLEEFVAAQAVTPGGFLHDESIVATCISDNYWLGRKPCITYGLRGICYFFLEVTCAAKDLHSGVYGGPVHEAMQDLCAVFATLNNKDGSPAIEGIQQLVRPVSAEEEASYADIDFSPEAFRQEVGANALHSTNKAEVLKRRWRYPTLSIHGVEGAWAGSGAKTVIPRSVIGKFSLRIVPDMTPEDVEAKVRAHVEKAFAALGSPNGYKLTMLHGAKAWLADPSDGNYRAARSAIKAVFGQEPDLTREGGSIPLTLWLQDATRKSVLLLPIGGCDDSAHSTNEKIDKANYIQGIKVLATYLDELGRAAL